MFKLHAYNYHKVLQLDYHEKFGKEECKEHLNFESQH